MLQKTTDKTLVTARDVQSKQLKDSISKGNIPVLVAAPGLGRRQLLQQFAAERSFYMDLKRFSMSPESFSVEFMCSVCSQAHSRKIRTITDMKALKLQKASVEIIAKIENELEKIKPDQRLILASALSFARTVSDRTIIFDNFEEYLKLKNFSQVKDCVDILLADGSGFVLSSSAQNLMRSVFERKGGKRKVDIITLQPFDATATRELFESVAGKVDKRITDEVFRYSAGIPNIIQSIADGFRKTDNGAKDVAQVRYIYISQITTTTSRSYSFCSKLFTESLDRARGDALLKTILKAVSQNRPMRLTEIARLIYRSSPVTKSLLERLVEVDLITKDGTTFDFSSQVLKDWCRYYFDSIEFDILPDEKTVEGLGGGLQ